MSKLYDLVIIGAGIAGCTLAYFTKEKDILLIDSASTPATGGSGAAGAFISPKLGKLTPLVELTNNAYYYSTNFYKQNFKEFFDRSGVLRIPKNKEDENNLEYYQKIIGSGEILDNKSYSKLGVKIELKSLFFKDGGVCDAQNLCMALIKNINFKQFEAKEIIKQKDNTFLIKSIDNKNYIKAQKVVLATGYKGFYNLDYMGIKGLWGSRGDFYSKDDIKVSMHQNISVSANNKGIIKIGATHLRVKNSTNACMLCDGKPLDKLKKEAKTIANINNLQLKETFCGMRASSRDYFPLIGEVIDIKFMLENYPNIKKGFNKVELKKIENLYVFNGLGGRGFVFAPLLAKWLKEFIFENKKIDKKVNSDRLFFKWVRKLK